jgi:hypothetical protein
VDEPAAGPGRTRLVLAVTELSAVLPGAQIALLDPFLAAAEVDEGVVEELRDLFADVVPFAFVLGEAARFPGGAAYLPPRPAAAFRSITQTVRKAFPETTVTSQTFDTVIPHLPVPDDLVGAVSPPVEAHAREALLIGPDGALLATFRFGTSAA